MTNRTSIRFFSYALCIVAVLAAYAIIGHHQSATYKSRLEASYQQSLTQLSECLDSIETNLTKSTYASTTTMMQRLSEDLFAECSTAKNALSNLPIEQMNLSGAYKFLSQAGDYASYLCDKVKNKTEISDEEYENLQKLLDYAKKYAECVNDMVTRCASGGEITENEIENSNGDSKVSSLSLDFTQAEDTFSDYPTLLYDGPFADAVLNKEAEVKKEAEITREEALKQAAKALYTTADKLTFAGEEAGNVPCYDYVYENCTVAISKNGGHVAYILCSDKVNDRTVTEENAINVASAYLKRLGYEGMTDTYYANHGNICLINFAYSKNGIIYYSDLIKVGVSLEDGKIYSFEAEGYLTNHKTRQAAGVKISEEELRSSLSKHVDVISNRLCVIPKDNGTEVSCIEYHCAGKKSGDEVLIYINAQTGEEENILMLLYSDNGTLTK